MASKEFILQRITAFAEQDLDPCVDADVSNILRTKFSIYLPQRPTLDSALEASTGDHEFVELIKEYRALVKGAEAHHKATDGLSPPPPYAQY